MILLGVGISIAVVVFVGFLVSRRVAGDSANFLVGGRMLPLYLVGGALMGSAVDTNATLGNTDLAAEFGFWAGACLPLGLALCLLITGIFFAKPMNRMGLTSFPDYYRLRFGRQVEIDAGCEGQSLARTGQVLGQFGVLGQGRPAGHHPGVCLRRLCCGDQQSDG